MCCILYSHSILILCKSILYTFASVNCMSGYIQDSTHTLANQTRFSALLVVDSVLVKKLPILNLSCYNIYESPVCKYLLWIASPDLFSCQAVGFSKGGSRSVARCHRPCHKSTRLLHIL